MRRLTVLWAAVIIGACGSSDDTSTAAQGEVTLSVSNIRGAQGKVLVVFAFPSGGGFGNAPAGLCAQITSDPFSLADKIRTKKPMAGTPCDLEDTPHTFAPGTQNLAVQVFAAGSMTPEQCAQTTVKVDGDTTVSVPALGPCN